MKNTTKITIYTTYYKEDNNHREGELLTCLKKNISNKAISKIIVFNEGDSIAHLAPGKIEEVFIGKRPTYQDFINYINANSNPDDIHVIANTDIYFDLILDLKAFRMSMRPPHILQDLMFRKTAQLI